jgi:hypothetical protein
MGKYFDFEEYEVIASEHLDDEYWYDDYLQTLQMSE